MTSQVVDKAEESQASKIPPGEPPREYLMSAEIFSEFSNFQREQIAQTETATRLTVGQARLLSEIQVAIGVELSELTLSAEALLDMLPGQAFEFEFDPLRVVSLKVGGEEIGKARFVVKGEQLALQIVSIVSMHEVNNQNNQ